MYIRGTTFKTDVSEITCDLTFFPCGSLFRTLQGTMNNRDARTRLATATSRKPARKVKSNVTYLVLVVITREMFDLRPRWSRELTRENETRKLSIATFAGRYTITFGDRSSNPVSPGHPVHTRHFVTRSANRECPCGAAVIYYSW